MSEQEQADTIIRSIECHVFGGIMESHCPLDYSAIMETASFYRAGTQKVVLTRQQIHENPTSVVLDTGCTRAMGSWRSIQRFLEGAGNRVRHEILLCNTRMSFANAESKILTRMVSIWFPSSSDEWTSTCFDILEVGDVPLLMSMEQVQNLYLTLTF